MEKTHGKIYWHDAFFEAVQLELADYKDILDFGNEYQLSKEALKMDVLIIKKEKDAEIKKNIGRIFKGYNICEYKSETDSLSIYDYNKVIGYALLYSAFEHIDIKNITITFAVTKHPRELLKYLENERKLEITEVFSGVYYVTGDLMPVQLLENKRLSEDDNLFLKSLHSNLGAEDMIRLLIAYQKRETYDKNNAYINRIMEANLEILKEVSSMSMVEVDAILKEAALKKGWIIEARQEGKQEGKLEGKLEGMQEGRIDNAVEVAREMLLDGEAIEKIVKWTKLPITKIKELNEQIIAQ